MKYLNTAGVVVAEETLAWIVEERRGNATLYFDNGTFSARISPPHIAMST